MWIPAAAVLGAGVAGWLAVTWAALHRGHRRLLRSRALLERRIRAREAASSGDVEKETFRVAVFWRRHESETGRWRRRTRRFPASLLLPLLRIDEPEPIAVDLPPEPRRLSL